MTPDPYELLHDTKSYVTALMRSILLAGLAGMSIGIALAATPTAQKAIVQTGYGGPEILKLQTVPVLEPGAGQVLIRVYAAAINPADWKSRVAPANYSPAAGAPPVASIAGGDVAGVIEKVGSGVTSFKVGDPVFAIIPRIPGLLNGAYSEFAIAPVDTVVLKPKNITYTEAAGLGIATVTGIRAVNVTNVTKGQRVLITGVSGGVGSAALQTAKVKGAYVIGTASARHHDYLRSLGIDEIIDYTKVKFEDQVRNVDVVIDTVGEDTAERSFVTLKKGGMYISVAARNLEPKCAAAGVTCAPRGSAAGVDRSIFEEAASLAGAGKLNVHIDKTFPLAQAAEAQIYGEQGRTQGKISLIVNAAEAGRK